MKKIMTREEIIATTKQVVAEKKKEAKEVKPSTKVKDEKVKEENPSKKEEKATSEKVKPSTKSPTKKAKKVEEKAEKKPSKEVEVKENKVEVKSFKAFKALTDKNKVKITLEWSENDKVHFEANFGKSLPKGKGSYLEVTIPILVESNNILLWSPKLKVTHLMLNEDFKTQSLNGIPFTIEVIEG